jgi:hypothetical protein
MHPQKDDYRLKGHSKTRNQERIYPLHKSEKSMIQYKLENYNTNLIAHMLKYKTFS